MNYFDHAATTPPRQEVLETFASASRDYWANPQSPYPLGARAEQLLERSRARVLSLLGAERDYRCVFTSGATESNNMALIGAAKARAARGKHLVTSAVEHPSVLEVCRFLETEGWELTVLPVTPEGVVDAEELARALRPDTTLVSLMHVNNEVGAVNDIDALGRVIHERSDALFHVDAAQSAGKFALALDGGTIDLLTFSAHKFHGLKGSGALLMKNRLELPPLLRGGGQEWGARSGTADPARAAALAKALRLSLEDLETTRERVARFKRAIVDAFMGISGARLNGSLDQGSPFIINVSLEGAKPETVLRGLAEQEIYISTVSACAARDARASAVVLAMTGDTDRARTSVRVSLSALTTEVEVRTLRQAIGPMVESLRARRK